MTANDQLRVNDDVLRRNDESSLVTKEENTHKRKYKSACNSDPDFSQSGIPERSKDSKEKQKEKGNKRELIVDGEIYFRLHCKQCEPERNDQRHSDSHDNRLRLVC